MSKTFVVLSSIFTFACFASLSGFFMYQSFEGLTRCELGDIKEIICWYNYGNYYVNVKVEILPNQTGIYDCPITTIHACNRTFYDKCAALVPKGAIRWCQTNVYPYIINSAMVEQSSQAQLCVVISLLFLMLSILFPVAIMHFLREP